MITTVKNSNTLLKFIAELYPQSPKTRIKKLLHNGNILCNNKKVTLHSLTLSAGDIIEIVDNDTRKPGIKNSIPFPVLYEDDYIIIIDKPAGISTSSVDNSPNIQSILSEAVKINSKGKIRTYVVHRLDKEVSGILLFAKSEQIMNLLKDNWKNVVKQYYALVEGLPKESKGTIRSWLAEDKFQKMYSSNHTESAKYSITHYKVEKKFEKHALLDIQIETGRKNQIRVHLADMGYPIVGDRKYGASKDYIRRIRLHAYSLFLSHPITGKALRITSPMPKGFLSLKDRDERYK
jgi:23S rRNA pseudouridine1911/1915/1917 synthase